MSYSYKARSPSRVDLSGGTLDCWPLYLYFLPVSTINISIDIYTEVEIFLQKEGITVEMPGLNKKYYFSSLKECLKSQDAHLSLLQAQLKFWKPRPDVFFKIIINSESPIGAGLGASSSLCISLLKVFKKFSENNFCVKSTEDILGSDPKNFSTNSMVRLASNLEAQVLKMPTGTQDYFPAITEGLHIINYTESKLGDHLLKAPYLDSLAKHLVLVYTGQPHNSGVSNWQVIRDYLEGSDSLSSVLEGLSVVSQEMKELLLSMEKETSLLGYKKYFSSIPSLFSRELELRKKLNSSFVTEKIENLRILALRHGGEEIKVCGAGAGGCVLVWVAPENKISLQGHLEESEYKVLNFNFVSKS